MDSKLHIKTEPNALSIGDINNNNVDPQNELANRPVKRKSTDGKPHIQTGPNNASSGDVNNNVDPQSELANIPAKRKATGVTSDENRVICYQCAKFTAVTYCSDCPCYLCQSCHQAHTISTLTKSHTYKDLYISFDVLFGEEWQASSQRDEKTIFCTRHISAPGIAVCRSCMIVMCRLCRYIHDNNHQIITLCTSTPQLQSLCLEAKQASLNILSKLDSISQEQGSTGEFDLTLDSVTTLKQEIAYTASNKCDNIIKILRKGRKELDDRYRTDQSCRDQVKYMMSKLNSACTSSNRVVLIEALGCFYNRYGILNDQTLNCRSICAGGRPDTVQIQQLQNRFLSFSDIFEFYEKPVTKYDNMTQNTFLNIATDGVLDCMLISKTTCVIAYGSNIDVIDLEKNICLHQRHYLKPGYLELLDQNLIFIANNRNYITASYTLELVRPMSPMLLLRIKAITKWDSNNMLGLTFHSGVYAIFLLPISASSYPDTYQMPQLISLLPELGNRTSESYIISSTPDRKILVLCCRPSTLFQFNLKGELLFTTDLHFISKQKSFCITTFCVDSDDNLLIGCANGDVCFVDYKQNIAKPLLSVWGPVKRIGMFEDRLFIFVSILGDWKTDNHVNATILTYNGITS